MDIDNSSNLSKEGTNGALPPSTFGSTSATTNFSSKMRRHRAYFTPEEVATLSQKQGTGTSQDTQEKMRQLACTFMEAVGQRMGLWVHITLRQSSILTLCHSPRKTIATSQMLYHRFRLFFPLKDFSHFVSIFDAIAFS